MKKLLIILLLCTLVNSMFGESQESASVKGNINVLFGFNSDYDDLDVLFTLSDSNMKFYINGLAYKMKYSHDKINDNVLIEKSNYNIGLTFAPMHSKNVLFVPYVGGYTISNNYRYNDYNHSNRHYEDVCKIDYGADFVFHSNIISFSIGYSHRDYFETKVGFSFNL